MNSKYILCTSHITLVCTGIIFVVSSMSFFDHESFIRANASWIATRIWGVSMVGDELCCHAIRKAVIVKALWGTCPAQKLLRQPRSIIFCIKESRQYFNSLLLRDCKPNVSVHVWLSHTNRFCLSPQKYQQTPLHISSQHGHNNIVKKLLSLDITVDCVDHVS